MDLGICMASHVGDIDYVVRAEALDRAVDDLLQDVFVVLVERGFEERSEPETTAFLRETARRLGAARSRAMRRTRHRSPMQSGSRWTRASARGD